MMNIRRVVIVVAVLALVCGCGGSPGQNAKNEAVPQVKTPSVPVKTEVPKAAAPTAAAPTVVAPTAAAPETGGPETGAPKTEALKAEAPKVDAAQPASAPADPAKAAEPKGTTFKEWDFTALDPKKWEGVRFPADSKQKWPGGAAFTLWKTAIGPQFLKLKAKASDFDTINITLEARRTKDGKTGKPVTISSVTALWAADKDAKGKRPYVDGRSARFEQKDPKEPNVWTVDLSGVKAWQGSIAQLGLKIGLPEALKRGGKDRYLVVVKKIEFVKRAS